MARRIVQAAAVATAAILSMAAMGGTAGAAVRDRTPPTASFLLYSQAFNCFTLYIGAQRATDNMTPQLALRYEVYIDGSLLTTYADNGYNSAAWATVKLRKLGLQYVSVRVIDRAGNRSVPTRANPITGYACS